MNPVAPETNLTRREALRDLARSLAVGTLVIGATALTTWARHRGAGSCPPANLCSSCARFTACDLPPAQQAKAQP